MKFRYILAAMVVLPVTLLAAGSQLLGWNNLGMHCMDSDYSVFSILPPYNTIEAQLIVGGKLVTNGSGYTVTYQAVVDASGSLNSTAMGKGIIIPMPPRFTGPCWGRRVGWQVGICPAPTTRRRECCLRRRITPPPA